MGARLQSPQGKVTTFFGASAEDCLTESLTLADDFAQLQRNKHLIAGKAAFQMIFKSYLGGVKPC